MAKKLHVGNLGYSVTEDALRGAFSSLGNVESVTVVKDKISGRSKGFGFVEMSTDQEAADAIEKLNKTELEGRVMFVSEARSTVRDGGGYSGNRDNNRFGGRNGGDGRSNHRFRS
ncbi:MAG: RNA-binding protein [Holosporaceae bacterium]|jgi:RNA recognition motif-containing protein|nr:RNA-binding protein [Holosporaceae bacterium]